MGKQAYITLFSNEDYIYCLLGLYGSWKRTNSKYPFVCAYTNDISQATVEMLKRLGMILVYLPPLEISKTILTNNFQKQMPLSFVRAMPKLQLFSLDYDKLVYLDSDTLILQNLDRLFTCSHMSGVVDLAFLQPDRADWDIPGDKWFRYFNAGMLVIEPKKDLTAKIVDMIERLPTDRTWSDQNILAAYYRNWPEQHQLHLPVYYNVLITGLDCYMGYGWFNANQIALLHYVANYKPVPRLWGDIKLKIPNGFPQLATSVNQYFDFIDTYILEEKEKGNIPNDFTLVKDLEGTPKNVALYKKD